MQGETTFAGSGCASCAYPTQKMSQRALADKLQLLGIDVDKNAIQRIESGKRFVTDIELKALATVFFVPLDELI